MKGPMRITLTQWHKSIGITVLVLSVLRLIWRLITPAPPLPAHLAPWERALAHGGPLAVLRLHDRHAAGRLDRWSRPRPSITVSPVTFVALRPGRAFPGFEGMSREHAQGRARDVGEPASGLVRLGRLRPYRAARGRRPEAPVLRQGQRARPHGPLPRDPGREREWDEQDDPASLSSALPPAGRRDRRERGRTRRPGLSTTPARASASGASSRARPSTGRSQAGTPRSASIRRRWPHPT